MRCKSSTRTKTAVILGCLTLLIGCKDSLLEVGEPVASEAVRAQVTQAQWVEGYEVVREYTGFVQSPQQAKLGLELAGKIKTLHADVGDLVEKGQPILTLDTQLVEKQAEQLLAQKNQIIAQLSLVEANLSRQRALKQKGFSAEAKIDELISQKNVLEASREQLTASLAANQLQQDKSKLLAPFSGIVTQRNVALGEVITAGSPAITLVSSEALEIHIGLPIHQLAMIKNGQHGLATVNGERYPVTYIGSNNDISNSSRSVVTRFKFDGQQAFVNGAIATLEITQEIPSQGVWVPLSALTDGLRGTWNLFTVDEQSSSNLVQRKVVEVLYANDQQAFVSGAIKPNELIVTNGLHRLVAGQAVTPEVVPTLLASNPAETEVSLSVE